MSRLFIGGVSPGKVEELLGRIRRLGIDPSLIEERFIKGGGKGGQKVNKTANCVQLRYPPLGLEVRCQRERSLATNRFLALRELVDRVEMRVSPGTSERLKEIERIRRRKARRRRRNILGPKTLPEPGN
ncbi:MAG: peptide chain release factor-like protein [Elusimicrobiota bacterium]